MKKALFLTAIVSFASASSASADPAGYEFLYERVLTTKYGTLSVDDDNFLLLNSKVVRPEIQGNSGLTFLYSFGYEASDVILVEDLGGSGCPALYYLITITKSGVSSTPEFGRCNEISQIRRSGPSIAISMPSWRVRNFIQLEHPVAFDLISHLHPICAPDCTALAHPGPMPECAWPT